MNQPAKRRRPQPTQDATHRASPRWSLIAIVAAVLLATGVLSFIFLRSPTLSNVDQGAGQQASSSSEPNGGDDRRTSPLSSPALVVWTADLPYATHGSPRLSNVGGHLEMLITFGDERKQVGGAMGIDVASGQVRWHVTSEDALFSLPMPLTPRPSGESPWVVAGRNGQLYSVDAVTGEQLWKFQPSAEQGRAQGIYNFFTGRELSDVDDDGIRDYLIPNGGDSQKGRWESRPPGHLLVVSGRDGSILHKMKVPDGGETYCSPLIWARADGKHVVFGTGGETFPGSLWTIPLEKVEAGTLDGAQVVVGDVVGKGAVAPPSLVDLDADGIDDLVAVPFDGRLVVVSGKSLQPLWDFAPPGENETQSSPAVGDFDGDGDLDVGYVVQRGVFPAWRSSIIRVFDGGSGQLLWDHRIEDELSAASPMALDFDQDGKDELFFVHANPALFRPGNGGTSVSKLKLVHVDEGRIESIGEVEGFNAGTGWIGDAEEDGTLECYVPLTMDDGTGRLVRVDLKRSVPPRIGWGGYLGTNHDGIFASGSR